MFVVLSGMDVPGFVCSLWSCSTLTGTLHTTTPHVVNRLHAEYVNKTKISSNCKAKKAESLRL